MIFEKTIYSTKSYLLLFCFNLIQSLKIIHYFFSTLKLKKMWMSELSLYFFHSWEKFKINQELKKEPFTLQALKKRIIKNNKNQSLSISSLYGWFWRETLFLYFSYGLNEKKFKQFDFFIYEISEKKTNFSRKNVF